LPDRLLLALAEIADAFFVSFPPGPAVFAMLLLAGTLWTIRRDGRGGPSLLAALFAFEIANAPFWPRHGTGDWITTIAYGLIAVAGLLLATRVILGARNNEKRAAQIAALETRRQLPAVFALRSARRGGPFREMERLIRTNVDMRQLVLQPVRAKTGRNRPLRRCPRRLPQDVAPFARGPAM
jgi:hypothetical protein